MDSQELAISLATAFTFGCAAIYEMREHAPALTPPLIAVLLSLTMLTSMVALTSSGDADRLEGSSTAALRALR